jgi:glycine/D-amino acid oxidase-like deaminating enzyme
MKTYDWIVIGAGITGAAIAYELAKAGFSVLLLEKDTTPANATVYSYGGLAFWSGTTELTCQLCDEGMVRHRILSAELDADTQLRELDLLLTIPAFSNPESIAASYANFAISPKLLTPKEACELEPLLNKEAIAGALTVKHGHINTSKTTQAYIQAFLRAGGKMQIAQVTVLESGAVKTSTETYYSEFIAVCAGGFSRELLKYSHIPIRLYFSHAEILATIPVDLQLRTLVMPATLQRFQLEAESTKVDQVWDELSSELMPAILDTGAVQFQDNSIYIGQLTRIINLHQIPDQSQSEAYLRQGIGEILPALQELPGSWHHCLVAFSSDRLPLIGSIPEYPHIHVFSGFSNPLVIVPPLAQRFAKWVTGQKDGIIAQLSPTRFLN